METVKNYRSEASIPVLEATSAFARGVTLTEAFRLWQAHDRAKQVRVKGGAMATLHVYPASANAAPELRYCA